MENVYIIQSASLHPSDLGEVAEKLSVHRISVESAYFVFNHVPIPSQDGLTHVDGIEMVAKYDGTEDVLAMVRSVIPNHPRVYVAGDISENLISAKKA